MQSRASEERPYSEKQTLLNDFGAKLMSGDMETYGDKCRV